MAIGKILRDHEISPDKSVVLLEVTDGDVVKSYVSVAHRKDDFVTAYSHTEIVDGQDGFRIYGMRVMFNARNAEKLINSDAIAEIKPENITLRL